MKSIKKFLFFALIVSLVSCTPIASSVVVVPTVEEAKITETVEPTVIPTQTQTLDPTATMDIPDLSDWKVNLGTLAERTTGVNDEGELNYAYIVDFDRGSDLWEFGYIAVDFCGDEFADWLSGYDGGGPAIQAYKQDNNMEQLNAYMAFRDDPSNLREDGTFVQWVLINPLDGYACYYPEGEGTLGIQELDGTYSIHDIPDIPWSSLTLEEIDLIEQGNTFLVRSETGTIGRCPIFDKRENAGG